MKLVTVAIGEQYEIEAQRLSRSLSQEVLVFKKENPLYIQKSSDPLIDGLWHKCNFANYIDPTNDPILFIDADAFTLKENPFADFAVDPNTDFAYVPYQGTWHLPDTIRQNAFNFHGHKINSGFMYFKNLTVAKAICDQWQFEYLEREKLYNVSAGTSKYEYDEWALMIALSKLDYTVEILDKKWNDWTLGTREEILASDSTFFQSHDFLNIV
jgi:hypothetical protein